MSKKIQVDMCVYEDEYTDEEYGTTVYYFTYPEELGMQFIRHKYPHGPVAFTTISLTVDGNDLRNAYMQISPTIRVNDGLSDIDWNDLEYGIDYDDSTVITLIKKANTV